MHGESSKGNIFGPRCIAALGAGLLFPTPLFAVQAQQRSDDVGIATSVQVFFRSLGMTFGVAVGGTIFQNRWKTLVNADVSAGKIQATYYVASDTAEMAYGTIAKWPQDIQIRYSSIYANSLIVVWWAMTGFAIAGFCLSWLCRDEKLEGGLSGSQNFKEKERKSLEQE